MRAPLKFTLTDADGDAHDYIAPLFRADDGVQMVGRILGICSGPLATVAGAAASAIAGGGKLSDVLEQELGGIDTEGVANQLRVTFMSGAPAALLIDLVKPATRDGQKLAQARARDDAYAGNYLELLQAAWKVAEGNGFTLQLSMLFTSSVSGAAATPQTSESAG